MDALAPDRHPMEPNAAQDPQLLTIHTTVARRDDARRLARRVLRAGLAACAQLEPIESLYVWNGELMEEAEVRLSFKTTSLRRQALMDLIREAHPYELPEIAATPLRDADPTYRRWLIGQVQPPEASEPEPETQLDREPQPEPEAQPPSPGQSFPAPER